MSDFEPKFKPETGEQMVARKMALAAKLEELLELLKNEADYSKINCAAVILTAFNLENEIPAVMQACFDLR